jgi:hypothetical protein
MWKKLGSVNLTGSKAQLHLNTLSETGADKNNYSPEEGPRFRPYQVGSKGKAHTTVGLDPTQSSFETRSDCGYCRFNR